MSCQVGGCPRPTRSPGSPLCNTHYQRLRLHRSTDKPVRSRRDTSIERFLAQIDRGQECWLWTGALNDGGYGRFSLRGKTVQAHRFAYELWVGPIPAGLAIDHVKNRGCTSRACVNPGHLEAVTIRENVMRGNTLPAANAVKESCAAGHAFAKHGYVDAQGARQCRVCARRRSADYKRRHPSVPRRLRVTAELKAEIRNTYATGFTQKEVAGLVGCSQQLVSRVVRA